MRREFLIDLPLLGQRPYLHGTSLFNAMLSVCDQCYPPTWLESATFSSFKLIRESTANGRFVVSDASIAGINPNAVLVAERAGTPIYVGFIDEGRPAVSEPYDEESYYQALRIGDHFDGDFLLPAGRPREDFIRGLVGANKLLHQRARHAGSPFKRIRFLYLKDLDGRCVALAPAGLRLEISNLMVQERGKDEVWTINRVIVRAPNFVSDFRICYSASPG